MNFLFESKFEQTNKLFFSGGSNDHPDQLQAFQRAEIRLLSTSAEDLVPIQRPSYEADLVDDFIELPGDKLPDDKLQISTGIVDGVTKYIEDLWDRNIEIVR